MSSNLVGTKILATIRRILRRCEEVGEQIDYPGEGGERRFRKWIASELLEQVLDWPVKNVIVGERFDVLLVSDDIHPLATIETKTPYHKASKKERADFEDRLSGYPTLRVAYFTNGVEWDRLDIVVSGAELRVLERSTLDVANHSPEYAEEFFAPLRYRSAAQVTGQVYQVNRANSFIAGVLSRLSSNLDQTVAEFSGLYTRIFYGLREGRAGKQAQHVVSAVYSQWCGKSLRVTPEVAVNTLQRVHKEEGFSQLTLNRCLSGLGLSNEGAPQTVEAILSLAEGRREDAEALAETLWPVFAPSIEQLSAQTAHVTLARTLLYRVGEDERVFPRRLSGPALDERLASPSATITGRKYPATEVLESVRVEMQSFLPTVYLRGEFDWWLVLPEKRAMLNTDQTAWLRQSDEELELLGKLMLRRLSHYQFESVDVDIWRNIYEHYLPEDERQRLGGFYTPDELVNLVLDLGDYSTEQLGMCKLSYIDPACGSGAFVTAALGRLLNHLELDLPCHSEIAKKGVPKWKTAEQKLKLIGDVVHAIDLHPFASFLTTLNVLFMALPLYVAARKQDPEFTISLNIFSADGLERPDKKTEDQMHMFADMNSRIQLTADSYERYRTIMDRKFDRVFGNPPWGGVLKGALAPVYDNSKKEHFAAVFRAAAKGKYDIYGLFMERATQLLHVNGRFALLTQGTFLDKEWAKGLRKLLATKTRIESIVDLNPFGQLFFNAMNSPCATAVVNTGEPAEGECIAVVSQPPRDFRELKKTERRQRVVETVREVIQTLTKSSTTEILFASGTHIKRSRLRETADDRWDLSGGGEATALPSGWHTARELLEMRQGVTPGGCLELFLLDKKRVDLLSLEPELVRDAIKSKQLERWRVEWKDLKLFYPYHVKDGKSEPAFTIQWEDIGDQKLKDHLLAISIEDALDFERQIDARETDIVANKGINRESTLLLLKHRISLGLIKYPHAASYLVSHYEKLKGRVFEKKKFTDLGKRWYEYHRPRDPHIMLSKPRILSPTLIRKVRFVLDKHGYLSDHACLMLQPTKATSGNWNGFSAEMNKVGGRKISKTDLLRYCLAFLNSEYAQTRLVTGHRPTPKGSYAITEAYLSEIPIPSPTSKKRVTEIIRVVTDLEREEFRLTGSNEVAELEAELSELVNEAFEGWSQ